MAALLSVSARSGSRVDRKRKGIDDEDQQHRIACEAPQFLHAKLIMLDIRISARLFLRRMMASAMSTGTTSTRAETNSKEIGKSQCLGENATRNGHEMRCRIDLPMKAPAPCSDDTGSITPEYCTAGK